MGGPDDLSQLGWLGAFIAVLIAWLKWEVNRKVSKGLDPDDAPRDHIQGRLMRIEKDIVRLEEKVNHALSVDMPDQQAQIRCVKKELKDFREKVTIELMELRGQASFKDSFVLGPKKR